MINVIILHNYESPYRSKLFIELSKYVNLTVIYLQDKSVDNRLWSVNNVTSYNIYHLPSCQFGKIAINKFSDLNNLFKDKKYDVVFLSDNLPNSISNLFLELILRKYNIKKILWSEDIALNPYYPKNKKYLLMLNQILLKSCIDAVVSFTKFSAEYWKRQTVKKVFYCPQASLKSNELEFYNMSKKKNELKLFFVGSFTGIKNEEMLCETISKLFNEGLNIKLTLIGDGRIRKSLSRIYKSNAFSFLGFKNYSEIYKYYQNNHFLILPSKYDAWGMVVNESMSYGTPCIVSDSVGAKELVGDSGYIIENINKNNLINILLKAYSLNNEDYYVLREKSFKYAKNYTIEFACNSLLGIIKEVI
jgi:glycosyltransferase involved in cell wall biosynthesis